MSIGGINIGQELLNVPMGEMIRSMATAIADAQTALDTSSMRVAEMMSGRVIRRTRDGRTFVDSNNRAYYDDRRVDFGYVYSAPLSPNDEPVRKPVRLSMMELGFTPTFYQFVDTIIEVKISVSVTGGTENESTSQYKSDSKTDGTVDSYGSSGNYYYGYGWGYGGAYSSSYSVGRTKSTRVQTSQVNAAYTSKFNYSAEGASLLRTKLVPVPPPAILEERIREVMSIERSYEQWKLLDSLRKQQQAKINGMAADADKTAEQAELDEIVDQIKELIKNFVPADA